MMLDRARAQGAQSLVRGRNLSVRLGGTTILESVDLDVPVGGVSAIVGPNGAGKTTLLRAILGEVSFSGTIDFPALGRRPRVGLVPQRLSVDRGMSLSVWELLFSSASSRPLWLPRSGAATEDVSLRLAQVHAEGLAARRVGDLSGGELQRVLLALALQRNPELLILDELSAGVDVRGDMVLCELLEDLRPTLGFTQLMVSHDLAMVAAHAQHVVCLNRVVVASGPTRETLTSDNLLAAFGLHHAVVRPAATGERSCPCGGTHA